MGYRISSVKPLRPLATSEHATPVPERHHPDLLDPFALGEAPDADIAAEQIAVRVPVHAARGASAIDLPAIGGNAECFGDAARAGVHVGARRTAYPIVSQQR